MATSAGGQTATLTRTITHDGTAPTLAINIPEDGHLTGTTDLTVSGTASDANLSEVTVNRVATTLSAGSWTTSQIRLEEGENILYARAVDAAANSTEVTRTAALDTREPELSITDPTTGTIVGESPVTVSGTAKDANLDRVEIDGNVATLLEQSWTIDVPVTTGGNTIVVEAFDTLGNRAEASITIDLHDGAPSVHIDIPAEGLFTQAATVDVNGTVADGATVTVNGKDAIVTGGTFSIAGVTLLDGENVLRARAKLDGKDGLHTRTVVRDNTAPTIVRSMPSDGSQIRRRRLLPSRFPKTWPSSSPVPGA